MADEINELPVRGWDSDRPELMAYRLGLAEGFLHWLISLDEPGSSDRRTITLSRIIDRVRDVLRAAESGQYVSADTRPQQDRDWPDCDAANPPCPECESGHA